LELVVVVMIGLAPAETCNWIGQIMLFGSMQRMTSIETGGGGDDRTCAG
jgi:hypothetical protein